MQPRVLRSGSHQRRQRRNRLVRVVDPAGAQEAAVEPELYPPDTHFFLRVTVNNGPVRLYDKRGVI